MELTVTFNELRKAACDDFGDDFLRYILGGRQECSAVDVLKRARSAVIAGRIRASDVVGASRFVLYGKRLYATDMEVRKKWHYWKGPGVYFLDWLIWNIERVGR